jgi:hypothetical protein
MYLLVLLLDKSLIPPQLLKFFFKLLAHFPLNKKYTAVKPSGAFITNCDLQTRYSYITELYRRFKTLCTIESSTCSA